MLQGVLPQREDEPVEDPAPGRVRLLVEEEVERVLGADEEAQAQDEAELGLWSGGTLPMSIRDVLKSNSAPRKKKNH